jgi:hypothetical protein
MLELVGDAYRDHHVTVTVVLDVVGDVGNELGVRELAGLPVL